ncbi:MAG TPA: DnaB-like helicase C-terminal domain-containing protein [Thermoanaerobaculia bacterium]|nr:DnaB-like helicase C-terminal domain-containing protein [Thermoanaerobaculia bacterium]HXK66980.1 DnaB-like helicase C-terminal domain-containing protein [Thermoanaerobaculia bacterium]
MLETRALVNTLYSRLNIEETLKGLKPQKMVNYHLLHCPQCGKKNAYLYNNRVRFTCNWLDTCRFSMSLWDYIKKSRKLDDVGTLHELTRLANYPIPDLDEALATRVARLEEETDALEMALHHFKEALWSERGKRLLDVLKMRGHTEGEIILMDLGNFTTPGEVDTYLTQKGFAPSVIRELGLNGEGMGYTHKLVLPLRDAAGMLRGLIVQATEQAETIYLYTHEMDRTALFNLNEVRDMKELLVVESYLDALSMTVRGMKGVVATGGSTIHDPQVHEALRHGVRNLILVFNNTESGKQGVERSLTYLNIVGLKVFIASLVEGYGSPGEVMNGDKEKNLSPLGMQGLKELLRKPTRACEWKAERILSRYNLSNPLEWEKAKTEAYRYVETINDPIETEIFFNTMAAAMEISDDFFERGLKHYEEAQENLRIRQSLAIFLNKFATTQAAGQSLMDDGKYNDAKDYLERELRTLVLDFERVKARRAKDLSLYLRDKFNNLAERKQELLGLRLNRFKELTRMLDGIQPGLYILAAESFAGKTAFLTNLFMDILSSDHDVRGLFFSLDDDKDAIIHRLVGILTGLDINILQRWPEEPDIQKQLRSAFNELIDLAETGRLDLFDLSDTANLDSVESEIRKRAGSKLVVAIDGMFNLEERQDGSRGPGNIEISRRLKTLVDTFKIPIILTEELGNYMSGLPLDTKAAAREILDIGQYDYHAGVVWLLYPQNRSEYPHHDSAPLVLDFAKNKLSSFRGHLNLIFHKNQGKIDEVTTT